MLQCVNNVVLGGFQKYFQQINKDVGAMHLKKIC